MIEQLISPEVISMVGVPTVAFLLLFRSQETTIKQNTEALNNIRVTIEALKTMMDIKNKEV